MAEFELTGVLASGSTEFPTMLGTLANTTSGVTLFDHGNNVVRTYDATSSGLAEVGASGSLGGRISFSLFSQGVSLAGTVIDAALAEAAAGDSGSERAYLSTNENQANAASVLSATVSGTDYLFVAPQNGDGVAVYAVTNNGNSLTFRDSVGDTEGSYAANISAMSVVEVGGTTYLLVGSSSEHGVTSYAVGSNGTLTEADSFGRDESLPVQTVTAMDSAEIDGRYYVVVVSSGSSSLTVLEVAPGGALNPAEHVVDSLDTRMSGVTALDVVELGGGRVLVIAGGNDGGLTVYSLLPDGHLVPFQVIEGSTDAPLDRISAIGTNLTGDSLDLFVTTEGAPGVTQFTLDVSDIGNLAFTTSGTHHGSAQGDLIIAGSEPVQVHAGAGDDIIVDGQGRDRLTGDAGADTFVLIDGDAERDRILDYEFGVDTIDLSAWSMCYGTQWMTYKALSTGALRITCGNNSFDVFSSDGTPMTVEDFNHISFTFSNSYDVVRAPLQEPGPNTGAEYFGTHEADVLTGTAGDDQMHGGGGNDLMISGGGADSYWGGSGMDTVSFAGTGQAVRVNLSDASQNTGEAADDLFYDIESLTGCIASDHITGTDAENRLEGGSGNDWLDGLGGDDVLIGGEGHDDILGRGGNDYMEGGAGDDNMPGDLGNDEIHGGLGNDLLGGGEGNDLLYGDDGHDWLGGGAGNDALNGGAGDDQMSASYGDDSLTGNSGNDQIAAGPGADHVLGGSGNDNIGGGAGKDVIYGGVGNDTVGAGDGDDRIWGDHGNDTLNGGAGNDVINGGSGADRINAGAGNDVLTGGADADTFVFATHGAGEYDVITDFEADGTDVIQIAGVSGSSMMDRFNALDATQIGDDVHLTYGSHTMVLEDVSLLELGVDDFVFV
ncbi:hypothetical protein FHY55_01970 [Oceanicola sp. D3]|uniref:calcium-binding protein n=1 Tax=Oceanicola sp. D3 TaxID=2587163 RepID=UPI001120A234|nr:calcium-binding protein [Oceanicola sp. D3]QDC08083.1 hypothetical protein FHY55_01970 [Oceanicola sp. D3]